MATSRELLAAARQRAWRMRNTRDPDMRRAIANRILFDLRAAFAARRAKSTPTDQK